MKTSIIAVAIFLSILPNNSTLNRLSCNSSDKKPEGIDLCNYMGKPIKTFVSDIKSEIVDTIPSKQYTGNLTSIYFKLKDGTSYEVLPSMKYNEALYRQLRDSFTLSLVQDSSIKCIKYISKGEVLKECGCGKAP